MLLLDEEKGEDLSAGKVKESEIGTSTGTELNNEHSTEGYCNYIDAGLNKCLFESVLSHIWFNALMLEKSTKAKVTKQN